MKKTRILTILSVSIFSLVIIIFFFNNYLYKSKAASETITIKLTAADENMNLPMGTTKNINIDIFPTVAGTKISGFDINFVVIGNMVIDKIDPAVFVGGDNNFLTEVVRNNSRVAYVVQKANGELPTAIRIPLTVRSTGQGEAKLKIDYAADSNSSKTQVSGNISTYLYSFGTNPNTVQELVFNPGVAGSTAQGNSTLNFKLRFQGITGAVAETYKTMPVKITLKKENTVVTTSVVNFTVDDSGIWQGSLPVKAEDGVKYCVLVKGPMHIQKKICDLKPTEVTVGSYRSSTAAITLTVGTDAAPSANTLDFSGVTLLVGDLPLAATNGQDNVSDAADIGYLINNFDKKDVDVVKIGDLNRNGGVDAGDFGLIKYALSVKTDEE